MPTQLHTVAASEVTVLADGFPRMQYNPKQVVIKAPKTNTAKVLIDDVENGNYDFTLGPGDAMSTTVSGSDKIWGKSASGVQEVEVFQSA